MHRTAARWLFVLVAAGVIIALTLTPAPASGATSPFFCVSCGAWLQDDLNNVLLFAPFGLACAMLGLRPLQAAAAALAFSLCIEALQYAAIAGRDSSAADVLTNGLGGGLGGLTWHFRLWWPNQTVARRIVLPAAVLAGLSFGAAGRWFTPRAADGPYFPSLDPISGPFPSPARLLQATWNGRPLQCCPQSDWKRLQGELVSSPVDVRIRALLLAAPTGMGRLLTVWDDRSIPVVVIGIDSLSVWGAFATVGQISGARDFAVRTPINSTWMAGDTLEVLLRGERGRWSIRLDHQGRRSEGVVRQSPVMAAYYFLPGFATVHEPLPFWRWLVTQLPVIVVAVWSVRTGRRLAQWSSMILLVVTGVLVGSPWAFPELLVRSVAAVLVTFALVTAVAARAQYVMKQQSASGRGDLR